MIANNIFRLTRDLFTECFFIPYDVLRFTDGWWASNIVSVILISAGFIALFYWLGQMTKQFRTGTED